MWLDNGDRYSVTKGARMFQQSTSVGGGESVWDVQESVTAFSKFVILHATKLCTRRLICAKLEKSWHRIDKGNVILIFLLFPKLV